MATKLRTAALASLILIGAQAWPSGPDGGSTVGDRIVVKLEVGAAARARELPLDRLPVGLAELDAFRERHGVAGGYRLMRNPQPRNPELFRRVGLDRIYVLQLPRTDPQLAGRLIRELSRASWVEYAEPVLRMLDLSVPNDPQFFNQWAHENTGQVFSGVPGIPDADIDSTGAWNTETGNAGGLIAVIDGDFDLDHADLVQNFVPGYDFLDDDPDPGNPAGGHGTRVSGIAAARGNNSIGVSGVCWSCSLMPLRRGSDNASIANATQYAADHGADAINMSFAAWGGWPRVTLDAVEYARGLGAISIGGAGNDGVFFPVTPAALDNVLAVGGTTNRDQRVSFSNIGEHLRVVAPGDDVYTTSNAAVTFQETYVAADGTSMSTPFVSGLAGLLRSHDPGLHVNELWHLITLGAQDLVGAPFEDIAGFDRYMGHGRINAERSLELIDGPWLAMDRPSYVCAGSVTVALKDPSATAPVEVTLSGDMGFDTETLTLGAVTPDGYYEGTLPIAWAGHDGPVVPHGGTLDLTDRERLTATRSGLTATASIDCKRTVCPLAYRPVIAGDCDRDGALDPGELWRISLALANREAELLTGAEVQLTTAHPDVTVLQGHTTHDEVPPWFRGGTLPDEDGSFDPFVVRTEPGTPANDLATFALTVSGSGWESDTPACSASGFASSLAVPLNRQAGSVVQSWNFDDGTNQGFTHQQAHTSGQLSVCSGTYFDFWLTGPVTDRAHSGTHSMRCGDGVIYGTNNDGALRTPQFPVPAGGGALGFFTYMHSGMTEERLAPDGMTLEVLREGQTTWVPLPQVTYNADVRAQGCALQGDSRFPFGIGEVVDLLSGDGEGDVTDGDTFDREHLADLSAHAGQNVRVRFRFGADTFHDAAAGSGVWIDTVSLHSGWPADSWAAASPADLDVSGGSCPGTLELSWDPVAGAAGYNVYRSVVSCAEAEMASEVHGTTTGTGFSDAAVAAGVTYHYAVEATEPGSGCPGQRVCVPASCPCAGPPPGATQLLVDRVGADVLLRWDDPGTQGVAWNVYRDAIPDPSMWGGPHAASVADADPDQAGIQHVDAGAASGPGSFHYLITTVSPCGESAL